MNDVLKSEFVIAKILDQLMKWGIQECNLEFEELELAEEFAPFFFPCINWLVCEGVIRTKKISRYSSNTTSAGGEVMGPQLTSFGFHILSSKLNVGDKDITLESAVKKASQGGRSLSQMGDFFGGVLGGFTKSLGS